METRRLGRTDLDISVLSIGGLYTSSLAGGVAETRRIMRQAIELGVNSIDTAPAYADSEQTVGEAIAGLAGLAGLAAAANRDNKTGRPTSAFQPTRHQWAASVSR